MRVVTVGLFGAVAGFLTNLASREIGWWAWLLFAVITVCFFAYGWTLLKEFQESLMVAAKKGWREEQEWQ